MIGRAGALERLRTVVEMAELQASDLPTVALIAGEAGIGKTRLVRELLAILPRDVTVLSAIAEPNSLGHPFDIARQLATATTNAEGVLDDDPTESVIAAITTAAGEGRVAVVIEDLHWIDSDSVNVIDAIARQPLPNVVLFATYRPSDLSRGAPGGDLVLRLERRNEVDQFRLDRLDRPEVGMLINAITGRPPSSAAVEAVYRRSGGVPFVVEELMRFAGPDACIDDIVDAQLPWSLEEAVRQHVAALGAQERVIVEVLAVFGQPAGFDELLAVSDLDERELLATLRSLVGRDVIEEIRNDRLWFRHALLAESVTQQLLGRERRRLHERCFDTISSLAPDDFAALAHHANGAGKFEDIVAIARVGSRVYLDRGATFQALRLATLGLGEAPEDPALLSVATEAAWRLDFLAESAAHAITWKRVAATVADRIDAMRYSGRIAIEGHEDGGPDAVVADLIATAEALPDGADRARAEAAVAQLLMMIDDLRAVEWADRAIARAEIAGDKQILVQARLEKASAHYHTSTRMESLVALRDVAQDARALGDGVLLSRALNNTLNLVAPHGEESRTMRAELRTTTSAFGFDKLGHVNVMWWDAMAAQANGDLSAFHRTIDEWISWTPDKKNSGDYKSVAIALAAEEGRVADGLAMMEVEGGQLACTWDHSDYTVAQLSLAAVARDPQLGRLAFDRIVSSLPLSDNWFARSVIVQAVAASIELGIPTSEIRERLLGTFLRDHAARDELVASVQGLLLLADNDPDAAVPALRATIEGASECLPRYVEGSLHLSLATALLARGDRAGALAATRDSIEMLARWPGWRRDRADAMLARLEGTQSRPIGVLTARETEVASLIAEGLTNGQLAERLFISPKTAAVHVSNILAKLSLSSRTEIAAWSIRRDLPSAG